VTVFRINDGLSRPAVVVSQRTKNKISVLEAEFEIAVAG
jgi:hypothetical protein